MKVSSVSKGKGFQGVVKRHNFSGGPRTHGDKDQVRMGGSIGATAPARVFKGRKMPGRMGNDMITVANLEIVKIDLENNLLYLKGAVAGGSNALVMIKGDGNLKAYEEVKNIEKLEEKVEEVKIIEDIDNSIEVPVNVEQEKPQEVEEVTTDAETSETEVVENVEETKQEVNKEEKQ